MDVTGPGPVTERKTVLLTVNIVLVYLTRLLFKGGCYLMCSYYSNKCTSYYGAKSLSVEFVSLFYYIAGCMSLELTCNFEFR